MAKPIQPDQCKMCKGCSSITTQVRDLQRDRTCFLSLGSNTGICKSMQDDKPYLSLEPNCGIRRNTSTKEKMDLRTASQFRHGARRVLTSPFGSHCSSCGPNITTSPNGHGSDAIYSCETQPGAIKSKLVRPQTTVHFYTQRHEALYLLPQRSRRRAQLPYLRITQLSSTEMGWPKNFTIAHGQKPSAYHRQRIGEQYMQKIAIPDTTNNIRK